MKKNIYREIFIGLFLSGGMYASEPTGDSEEVAHSSVKKKRNAHDFTAEGIAEIIAIQVNSDKVVLPLAVGWCLDELLLSEKPLSPLQLKKRPSTPYPPKK